MKYTLFIITTIIITAVAIIFFVNSIKPTDVPTITLRRLADCPADGSRYLFSANNSSIAYIVKERSKEYVRINGNNNQAYNKIIDNTLQFSPLGDHYLYLAQDKQGIYLIRNGIVIQKFVSGTKVRNPIFSNDGQHIAYVTQSESKWVLVVDGKPVGRYANIGKNTFCFSPDGKHFAVGVVLGNGKWQVITDEKSSQLFDAIGKNSLCFSSDNKRLMYLVKKDSRCYLIVDNQLSEPSESLISYKCSNDGSHYAYFAFVGNKWFVYHDGKKIGCHDYLVNHSLILSTDGNKVAYVISRNGKFMLVSDNNIGPAVDQIFNDSICFNHTNEFVVYTYRLHDQWYISAGKVQYGPYQFVARFLFSPDSKRTAYTACIDNRWYELVDGKMGKPYKYAETLCFSDDSKHVVSVVQDDNDKLAVGIDGKVEQYFDNLLIKSVHITENHKVSYIAEKDNSIFSVEQQF